MRTNSALTIYNKYYSPTLGKEIYQRTVIASVHWEDRKARNILSTGADTTANQANIYIPKAGLVSYLAPTEWLSLVSKVGYWTLQKGDLVLKGSTTQEIGDLYSAADLKSEYNVLVISSVDDYDYGTVLNHYWLVGAK